MHAVTSMNISDKLRIKSYTKLMENLEVRDSENKIGQVKAECANELCVVSDRENCDIVIVNSYDNGAAAYYFAEKNASYDSTSIPLHGKGMAAGLDGDGRVYAYAIKDNKVYYSYESRPHGGNYSKEQELDITYPRDVVRIDRITVKELNEGHALFVMCSSKDEKISYVSCRVCGETHDYMLPVAFSKGEFAISGETKEELTVHLVAKKYARYGIKEQCMEIMPVVFPSENITIEQLIYEKDLFCLYRDHTVNTVNSMVLGAFVKDDSRIRVDKIADSASGESAIIKQKDGVYHYAVLGDYLLHTIFKQDFAADPLFPIDTHASAASFSKRDNEITLYYFQTEKNLIIRLDYKSETGQWSEIELDFMEPGEVRRMPCYSTEMTIFHPEYNCPMIDVEVELWTKERTYIETQRGLSMCDEEHKIRLNTDNTGKIYFIQYTNKIDAVPVIVSFPEALMDAENVLVFNQYEIATSEFVDINSNDIMNAKTTDSMGTGQQDFLSGDFRTKKNAEALAASINELMGKMPEQTNTNSVNKCMYMARRTELGSLGKLAGSDKESAWCLDIDHKSGKVSFKKLAHSDALSEITLMKQDAHVVNGFFSKIGDFFRAVGKKIAEIVKVVVDGIKSVVSCIIDGIKIVIEAIIDTVTAVLGFIETVFAAVLIFFGVIFMWIAALFQWDDVKRTQKAISGMLRTMMQKLPQKSEGLEKKLLEKLGGIKEKLSDEIDKACKEIAPGESIIKYTADMGKSNEDSRAEEAVSNDVLTRKISNEGLRSVKLSMADDLGEYKEEMDGIMDLLKSFANEISGTQAFSQAADYFSKAFSNLDGMFQNLFAALLKAIEGLLDVVLEGIGQVITAVFGLIDTMLKLLDSAMNKKIQIPFFSTLYEFMVGEELTFLNITSFVLAVPVTILHKLIYQAAPLESDAALKTFLEEYERVMGHDKENGELGWVAPKAVYTIASLVGLASSFLYSIFSYGLDNIAIEKLTISDADKEGILKKRDEEGSGIDWLVQVLEWVWFAASAPWAHKTEDSKPISDISYVTWSYFGIGCMLDTTFLIIDGHHIDKASEWGRLLTSVYGVLHIVMPVCSWVDDGFDLSYIAEFAGGLSETMKFTMNIEGAKTWCKYPVLGTDLIAIFVIFGINIACMVTDNDQKNEGGRINAGN